MYGKGAAQSLQWHQINPCYSSEMGYGAQGISHNIFGGSALNFDVDMLNVSNTVVTTDDDIPLLQSMMLILRMQSQLIKIPEGV